MSKRETNCYGGVVPPQRTFFAEAPRRRAKPTWDSNELEQVPFDGCDGYDVDLLDAWYSGATRSHQYLVLVELAEGGRDWRLASYDGTLLHTRGKQVLPGDYHHRIVKVYPLAKPEDA